MLIVNINKYNNRKTKMKYIIIFINLLFEIMDFLNLMNY